LSIADGVTKRNKNGINLTGWMNVFSSAQGTTDKDGMFRFDPKFEKEWLVIVESTGHKDEQTINMTATGGIRTQGGGEFPLYLSVFAGLGYLFGVLGISLWYQSYKQARKLKDK